MVVLNFLELEHNVIIMNGFKLIFRNECLKLKIPDVDFDYEFNSFYLSLNCFCSMSSSYGKTFRVVFLLKICYLFNFNNSVLSASLKCATNFQFSCAEFWL